jgi:hypothetical protein
MVLDILVFCISACVGVDLSGADLIRLGCRCLVSAVTLLDHNRWAPWLVFWSARGGHWAPSETRRQAAVYHVRKGGHQLYSDGVLIRLGCRCLVSAVTLLDHNRWATFNFHHYSLLKMCCICVISTEYTQSGNGLFLASIPSWWKTSPGWVRVGGACPPLSLYLQSQKVYIGHLLTHGGKKRFFMPEKVGISCPICQYIFGYWPPPFRIMAPVGHMFLVCHFSWINVTYIQLEGYKEM